MAGQARIAANVMHFARELRAAGLPVGSDRIEVALRALDEAMGLATAGEWLGSREDFKATLATCLVGSPEQRALFDEAFKRFWREPGWKASLQEAAPAGADDAGGGTSQSRADAGASSVSYVISKDDRTDSEPSARTLVASDNEMLLRKDFGAMDDDERLAAQRIIRSLHVAFEPLLTRRHVKATHPGAVDWRATLASMGRHGGDLYAIRWRRIDVRPAPILVLADVSGSMGAYARMLLIFAHALGRVAQAKVETFVFSTRLTRTTRSMRQRNPDAALKGVTAAVDDWGGGTRIAECLHDFNRNWKNRVLDSKATVLLISDGLERGSATDLRREMVFLQRNCRRLIWLNPLARFAGFEPKTAGMQAIAASADTILPGNDIRSLEDLAELVAGTRLRQARGRRAAAAGPVVTISV